MFASPLLWGVKFMGPIIAGRANARNAGEALVRLNGWLLDIVIAGGAGYRGRPARLETIGNTRGLYIALWRDRRFMRRRPQLSWPIPVTSSFSIIGWK